MTNLSIDLTDDRSSFAPGEEISGKVSWSADEPPRKVELRLFWFTRGKGTEDAGLVETVVFDQPLPHEARSFRVRLPGAPYSFSGQLISLVWALELVVAPGNKVTRREIVVGPGRIEVKLSAVNRAATGVSWINITTR